MRTPSRSVLPLLLLALAVPAGAEVLDAAPEGFTVQSVATVPAAPRAVYRALIDDVGRWWSSDHTFSRSAANLFIEGHAGGCFCERLPSGGGVRHMVVVFADPGRVLRLQGGIGPLQRLAVTGTLTFTLTPEGSGTRITLVYTVCGYRPGGLETLAPPVGTVLGEQLERFARFVATGSPEPPPTPQP